ncbi:MAG: mechanosensitive ion channel family protein [Bacteroidia bacterium]|nr:mechanosensitive ion channel family protein [Bacteroidia bacterium]
MSELESMPFFEFDILKNVFWGSTLNQWMWCIIIITAGFLLSKLIYRICGWITTFITRRTETTFDDKIVEHAKHPFMFMVILISFYVGLHRLTIGESASAVINKIYVGLMTINVTWFISGIVHAFMNEVVRKKTSIDTHILNVVHKTLIYVVWGMGVVIALTNVGYDVSAMIAGLGIGGLALAMAAQDSVSNFFGGFTIFTDHPFKVGDRIRIGGNDGTVFEIGIRSFRMRTLDGTVIIIPNSQAVSQVIENISNEPTRKIKLQLGLTYDTTPEQMQKAMKILDQIGLDNDEITNDGNATFNSFGDFSLNILFVYYIKKGSDVFRVQNDVNMEILKRFNAEGLNFAFPTQTVYTINN